MRPRFYSKLQAKLSLFVMYFCTGPQPIPRQIQSSAGICLNSKVSVYLRSHDYPGWLDLKLNELCTTFATAVLAPMSEFPNSKAAVALETSENLCFSQKFCLESLERMKKEALLF